MRINLINYALAKKDWKKAYEDLKVLEVGGRNLLLNSEDFSRWVGNAGATVTKTKVDMTEEWGISNAVRMKTIGGTNIIKLLYTTSGMLTEPLALDKVYTYSIYVKNMGTKDIRFHINGLGMPPNTSTTIPIKAGESGRFSITGKRRDNYDWFQPQFRPLDVSDDIDVIVGREKIEKGDKATDWTPAPEDINAHPFVAELAETVYRSKQNEERIRNLENAITALGGGS